MEETLKGLAYSFLKATNQRPLVTHQMHMWFFSLPPPTATSLCVFALPPFLLFITSSLFVRHYF